MYMTPAQANITTSPRKASMYQGHCFNDDEPGTVE